MQWADLEALAPAVANGSGAALPPLNESP